MNNAPAQRRRTVSSSTFNEASFGYMIFCHMLDKSLNSYRERYLMYPRPKIEFTVGEIIKKNLTIPSFTNNKKKKIQT